MLTITNAKVAGFAPRWAAFRGFSILFDNPGRSLTPSGDRLDLACDVTNDAALHFYRTLNDALAALNLNLLTNTYLFCPLPPPSYHVTVWDGGNDGNLAHVVAAQHPHLDTLLAGLPDSLLHPNVVTDIPLRSSLVTKRDWPIRFRLESLVIWGNIVLVARLAPADDASTCVFHALVAARSRLNARYREALGISPSDNYTPHVSLGYFANKESAQLSIPCLATWNALFLERLSGMTLDFDRASLYGFTDMATFFKAAEGA
jgi:hypothetical protein